MVALQSDGRPLFVLYARGTLSTALEFSHPTDAEWTWAGHIDHRPPGGEVLRHELTFSSETPEEITLDGRTVPIPNRLPQDPDEKPRGPWFVLTSYGRAVPTGRFFWFPDIAELDHERQYSIAYYIDRSVYEAETHRNTLELDDLDGWILAWDEQHCISHSDGARIARLRVFADGRFIANRRPGEPLIEKQITQGQLRSLLAEILKLDGIDSRDAPAPGPLAPDVQFFPNALGGGGLWDQGQEFIQVREEGKQHSLRVVHPGRTDRVGRVPQGWEEVRKRLWEIVLRSESDNAPDGQNLLY